MFQIDKLIITPWFLLFVVVIVAFLGWLLAVKLRKRSDKFWRVLNFIGLTFSCLGLFGIVKDGRLIINEREYYNTQQRIEGTYRWRLISNLIPDLYCREFVKTEYSPNDLDLMQEDYNKTCQWIKDNKEYICYCYHNQEPIITDSICYPILRTSDYELEYYFKTIRESITDYNNDVVELRKFKKGLKPNNCELIYIFLSPLLLAIGLGWEYVKFFAHR